MNMQKLRLGFILTAVFYSLTLISCSTPEPEIIEVTRIVEREVEVTPEPILSETSSSTVNNPYALDSFYEPMIVESFQSERFDETLRLYISLPNGYYDQSNNDYPIIYLADGNFDTELASLYMWQLGYIGLPDTILVGFGYDTNEIDVINMLRERDLLPYSVGGESRKVFDTYYFLENELIPHIEGNYRTDPERRFLYGNGVGGHFTIFAMFQNPELFEGYVATSPAIIAGGWSAIDQADEYAAQHDDLPANLFISIGAEDVPFPQQIESFEAHMNELAFDSFKIKTTVFESEDFPTMGPIGMYRGFREILTARAWE